MQVAIMLEPQEDVTWEPFLRVVDRVDELGFHAVWRSDHLFSVIGAPERNSLALWPALTMFAIRTQRAMFGQLVSPVTFRHPVELAQHAVALDHLSGGRYILGVGTGWYEREHRAFGFQLFSVRERLDRFEEALKVIQLLWTGERVSFEGRHFHLQDAVMRPRPLRGRVPIMIGGGGERRTLRLVAEHADYWNPGFCTPDVYQRKEEALREHCRAVGRDPGTIVRTLMTGHVIGRNRQQLLERGARLQRVIVGEQPLYVTQSMSVEEFLEVLRRRGWFVGTVDEVIEQLRVWEHLGIQQVMFQTFDLEDMDALELIARQIVPAVA